MKKTTSFLFAFLIYFSPLAAHAGGKHKIRVVVGHSIITDYHIQQRTNLMLMSSPEVNKRLRARLKAKSTQTRFRQFLQKKRPQSREEVARLQKQFVAGLRRQTRAGLASGFRKKVLDELIDEHLMIDTAKQNNIVVSPSMIEQRILTIAKRNSKGGTPEQAKKAFFSVLKRQGVDRGTFEQKIKAVIAWQQLIRQKFSRDIRFTDRDVEQQMGVDYSTARDKKVVFNLQQIIVTVPNRVNQAQMVQKLVEAEAIRQRFNGCSNMKSLLAPYPNARSIALGRKTLDKLPSVVGIILGNMKAGEISPPQTTAKGIEMYAVCDRKQVTLDHEESNKIKAKLRQDAFQRRAKRYLKDLREEAYIERRNS